MRLAPVPRLQAPSYPQRPAAASPFARLVRRALAAACASGALWLGGCYGSTPARVIDDRDTSIVDIVDVVISQPPLPDDTEIPPGAMPAPSFACGEAPEWSPSPAPGYLEGSLCGEQPAVAALEVSEAGRYTISLSSGGDYVFLSVRDPEGEEEVELTPDLTEVDLDLSAGPWSLVASAADPMDYPNSWFSVWVSYAD